MESAERHPASALFESSIDSIRQGDVETALVSLSEAYEAFCREMAAQEAQLLRPPDPAALDADIRKIRQYLADGKLEDAALHAGIVSLSFPDDPRLRKLDGEIRTRAENHSQMDDFISAAQRQRGLGEWNLAIQSYERARKLDPGNSFVQQQMSEALLAWAKDLAARDRKAALNLLQTSLSLRDDAAARELQDQIIADIEQENMAAILANARALQAGGRYGEARAELENALVKWPAAQELAACLTSVTQQEEASRAVKQVEERVRSLAAELRFEEAGQAVEAARQEFPQADTLARLQREIREKAFSFKAELALSQIVPLDSRGTVSSLRQALNIALDGLQQAKDSALLLKARERLEKRLTEKEGELRVLLSRVDGELARGEMEVAKETLQRASIIDPDNPRIDELRGQMKKARRASVWSWLAAEKASPRSAAAEPVRVGQVLAERYEILAPLGSGGMSTVYKARDLVGGYDIALKIVLPLISKDDKLRDRFKKEVHLARRLSHPNVIRIHDIAEHQEVLFISMELVEGQTLSRILAEKTRFTVEEFLELFKQFGPALAYIHSQKILHRDIKPQNLMYDRHGLLKIMDFGIARDLSSDHTTTAIPMGTPAYMSPELLEGAPLTPASDIYSAGTMFFELLTGSKPFSNASLYERMAKPVPRVSQIVPEIPDDLDEIVHRCMQIQPEHRFRNMDDLMTAVARRAVVEAGSAGTLAQLIRNEPAKIDDVLLVFLRILREVAAIHAAGRRAVLSPHAIRYSETGVEIRPASPGAGQYQTRAVDCKYAAAEDFQEANASGPAADTYVLGFIFYEILLGRRRFREEFPDCHGSDADLQWLNWHGDPTRAATPLNRVLPDFPPELSSLIERMMQKNVALRPPTAEVEAALTLRRQHLLRETGKTVVMKPGGARNEDDVREPARSTRKGRWMLAVFLLLALAILVWLAVNSRP